ncbi:flagellar biosynthesis protein FliQ [bacterium]|nr:flagellar biosynthesis protein FliQ [bacterium]
MDKSQAIDLIRNSLWFTIIISAPSLMLSVMVGLFISILQTTTQIHEQTLTFVPKIFALLAAAILFGPWMIESFTDYIWNLWSQLPDIAPH